MISKVLRPSVYWHCDISIDILLHEVVLSMTAYIMSIKSQVESLHRVGVTKAPFVNFSRSKIFDLAKVPVRLFESHSYFIIVTIAELRSHQWNMNACLVQYSEKNGTGGIGWVTPITVPYYTALCSTPRGNSTMYTTDYPANADNNTTVIR